MRRNQLENTREDLSSAPKVYNDACVDSRSSTAKKNTDQI